MSGPLEGVRVLEFASIGPGPFVGMMLSDIGADVVRVEGRKSPVGIPLDRRFDTMLRGRTTVELDLKTPSGVAGALALATRADIVIEGWRPGVAERLGVGPSPCIEANPQLIYGRMTGWGQDGPLKTVAGHDINYIALSGVLGMVGRAGEPPTPPLNLVGDFGGGGMLLAFGILAALWERSVSGKGQVVDAAMVDGSALLAVTFAGLFAANLWTEDRGTNLVDSGAPFYDAYETSDGKYIAVGAIEDKFQQELFTVLGLEDLAGTSIDPKSWPVAKERVAEVFRTRTRDAWCEMFEGSDACVSPVLSPTEAPQHPHNVHRGTFVTLGGITQPAPAPRFSRTPADVPAPPRETINIETVLQHWDTAPRNSSSFSSSIAGI
jgi:alpha-methylacyl-CoA racemase